MQRDSTRLLIIPFFFLFIFCFGQLSAQQTLVDLEPVAIYKKGLELYQNQQYGAAQSMFKEYLHRAGEQDQLLRVNAEYYIALSSMELFQNDAEVLLNDFMLKYPDNPKSRMVSYYLGKFYYRQKDYEKATQAFDKVDPADLDNEAKSDYLFMAGYAYFKQGNLDKAKDYFSQLKDTPGDNMAIGAYYYGYIAYQQGNYKDALAEFTKIQDDKKFKNVVPAYIAQIYLLQGKYDKVIEVGEAAAADKETEMSDELNLYVAEAYFMKKDYAKAAQYFEEYQKSGSLKEHYMYEYGYSLYMTDQYAGAIQAFNAINIKEDSLGQNVSYNLGNAYLKTGDKAKARNAFDFAYKLKFIPTLREPALLNYAKLSYDLNFQKEAIEAFKLFLKTYPNSKYSDEAKGILSNILLATNTPKEAKDILESIPNRSDKLGEAYQKVLYQYGMELFNNGQYEEAMDNYRKSLEQPYDRKTKALAYFWLAECQYRTGVYKDAMYNYKNFLYIGESKQTPYYNVAYYNIGYSYFKMEDYQNAATYFKEYLDMEGGSSRTARITDATLRLADADFVLKDYPDALSLYNSVINSHIPESDYALYQRGMVEGLSGNTDDKISTMRNLAKTYPNSPYVDDALFEVGKSYMVKGDFQQAIKELQNLNYNHPKNQYYRIAMLNIGQSYINMDQDAKAIPVFKSIINQYPYSDEAKQATRAIENSYVDRGMTDSLDQFYANLPNRNLIGNSQDSTLYASALGNVKKGDCNAAVTAFDKYLQKYPSGYFSLEANYYEAECQYKLNMNTQAQTHYNYVIAKSPNPYVERALRISGELYFKDKNYDMALKRYEQLEEVAANRQNQLLALNGELRANSELGNHDKVIETANKILNLGFADDDSKQAAQFYMGKSQMETQQLDQAFTNLTAVYQANKGEMGAEAMYDVANIQFLQEKYDDAQKTIFSLKDRYSFYDYWRAKAFILLADTYAKTGDIFQAKSTLQSIIDNYEGADLKQIAKDKLKALQDQDKQGNQ